MITYISPIETCITWDNHIKSIYKQHTEPVSAIYRACRSTIDTDIAIWKMLIKPYKNLLNPKRSYLSLIRPSASSGAMKLQIYTDKYIKLYRKCVLNHKKFQCVYIYIYIYYKSPAVTQAPTISSDPVKTLYLATG